VHPDPGVHPRLEQVARIRDVHAHGEHRGVLADLRLRLDLQDGALERAVRECIHRDRHRHSRLHLADVRFQDEGRVLYGVEVRHQEDYRAAAERWARDDGAAHRIELEDRAGNRRAHMGVIHGFLSCSQLRRGGNDRRLRRDVRQPRALIVGLRDGLALIECLAPLELRGGVRELCLSLAEIGPCLGQVVTRNPRVDRDEQLALLHVVARLHRHLENFAPRFRFHAERDDRLDHAGGGRRQHDAAAFDRDRFVQRRRLRLLAAGKDDEQRHGRGDTRALQGAPFVFWSRSMRPLRSRI
jgi:hypothetical protein